MDGGFFERYGSGFKDNFEEDIIIAEKDKFATLNEREISKIDNDIAERTQLSYKELLSSLLELNASIFLPTNIWLTSNTQTNRYPPELSAGITSGVESDLEKHNLISFFCFFTYLKTFRPLRKMILGLKLDLKVSVLNIFWH